MLKRFGSAANWKTFKRLLLTYHCLDFEFFLVLPLDQNWPNSSAPLHSKAARAKKETNLCTTFFSFSIAWFFIFFHRNISSVALDQNSSNTSAPLYNLATRASHRKHFLFLNHCIDFEILFQKCFMFEPSVTLCWLKQKKERILQKCFLCEPLRKLSAAWIWL